MESRPRQRGRVKFFNSTKGYGFIIPDDQAGRPDIEEVFVHHTAIRNAGGFKSLGEGEEVEYDLVQGPKGMQAANVSGPGGVPVKGDPYAGFNRNKCKSNGPTGYVPAASYGFPLAMPPWGQAPLPPQYAAPLYIPSSPSSSPPPQPVMMMPPVPPPHYPFYPPQPFDPNNNEGGER